MQLAKQHGLDTGDFEDASKIFEFADLGEFLRAYEIICSSIVDADDFHRVTYEMFTYCAANGARYVEFFFSPQQRLPNGVAYATMLDGVVAAIRDAERDHRVESRVVPALNRELSPEICAEFLDLVLSDRRPEVVGIGLDFNEVGHPLGPYARIFQRARCGLHVTAHAAEKGPSENVEASLDQLGCERIDHGYDIVDDPTLVDACRERGVFFTVCPTTTTHTTAVRDLSAPGHAIRRMVDAGLNLVINIIKPRGAKAVEREIAQLALGAAHMEGEQRILIDESSKRSRIAESSAEINRLLSAASSA
jgi:adenosine deaminase